MVRFLTGLGGSAPLQESLNPALRNLGESEHVGVILGATGIVLNTFSIASELAETGEIKGSSATDYVLGTGIAVLALATGGAGLVIAGAAYGVIHLVAGDKIDNVIDALFGSIHFFNKD